MTAPSLSLVRYIIAIVIRRPAGCRKKVEGIRAGLEHMVADESAASVWHATRQDLIKKHADMQVRWDQHMVIGSTLA